MRLVSVISSFAILLAGCYTNTPLTKDNTLNLDGKDLTFYLTDGTYIKSQGGKHHRIENGYKVAGKSNSNQYWKEFDGIVLDEQIKDITISEYDEDLTTIAIVATVMVLAVTTVIIVSEISSNLLK
jgi:hypothetical protein